MVANIIETLISNIITILYAIICTIGIAGNAVVVYVILSISSIPTAKLSFLKRNKKKN
jgi:phage shock protein PspC (stress-responsive transcriptional regulator)